MEGLDCSKITLTSIIVGCISTDNSNKNPGSCWLTDIFNVSFVYHLLFIYFNASLLSLLVQTASLNSLKGYSSFWYTSNTHLWTLPYKNAQLGKDVQGFLFLSHRLLVFHNSLVIWYYVSVTWMWKSTQDGLLCHLRKPHQSFANNTGWVTTVNAVPSPSGDLSRPVFSGWCKDVAELGRENWSLNSRWKKAEVVRWLFSFSVTHSDELYSFVYLYCLNASY